MVISCVFLFLIGYAAAWLHARILIKGDFVRELEEKANKSFERVSAHQLSWHITHMRGDVSGLAMSIGVTNALLAMIAMILLLK